MSPAVPTNTTAMATATTTITASTAAVEMPSAWSALIAMLPTYWWLPLSCAVFLVSAVHHTCQCWQLKCDRRRLRCCNAQQRAARVSNASFSSIRSNGSAAPAEKIAAADEALLLRQQQGRQMGAPAAYTERVPQWRRASSGLGAAQESDMTISHSPCVGPDAPTRPPSTTLAADMNNREDEGEGATGETLTSMMMRMGAACSHSSTSNTPPQQQAEEGTCEAAGSKAELRPARLTINTNLGPAHSVSQSELYRCTTERDGRAASGDSAVQVSRSAGEYDKTNTRQKKNEEYVGVAMVAGRQPRVRPPGIRSAMPSHAASRIMSPNSMTSGYASFAGSRFGSFGGACPLPESLKDEQRTIHLHVQKNAEACLEARRALESTRLACSTHEKA